MLSKKVEFLKICWGIQANQDEWIQILKNVQVKVNFLKIWETLKAGFNFCVLIINRLRSSEINVIDRLWPSPNEAGWTRVWKPQNTRKFQGRLTSHKACTWRWTASKWGTNSTKLATMPIYKTPQCTYEWEQWRRNRRWRRRTQITARTRSNNWDSKRTQLSRWAEPWTRGRPTRRQRSPKRSSPANGGSLSIGRTWGGGRDTHFGRAGRRQIAQTHVKGGIGSGLSDSRRSITAYGLKLIREFDRVGVSADLN